MTLSGRLNEYRTSIAEALLKAARKRGDGDAQDSAQVSLCWLHTQRSVDRVVAMEVEKGLR
jgi:hypothetical protein